MPLTNICGGVQAAFTVLLCRSWQTEKVEQVVNISAIEDSQMLQHQLHVARHTVIEAATAAFAKICQGQDADPVSLNSEPDQAAKLLRLVETEGAPGLAFAGRWASATAAQDSKDQSSSSEGQNCGSPQQHALQRLGTKAQFGNPDMQQAVVRACLILGSTTCMAFAC